MKLFLLITLLTAGAIAFSISAPGVLTLGNVIQCTTPGSHSLRKYINYDLLCLLRGSETPVEDLDKCCQTRDNCLAQLKYLKSCTFLRVGFYTSLYSYSCSGNEITCSDQNNPCEDLICNCDRQAAICFSKAPYNK